MAEAALSVVGKSLLAKVADLAQQQISLGWFAKDELIKLQGSLDTINVTVQAFEEGQYVRTSATNNWLEKLKDVAYDAEDILDEFDTEVSRQRMEEIGFGTLDEVWEFSSRLLFNFKMGCQIKEIRKRLDNITKDRDNFHPKIQPNFHKPIVDIGKIDTHSSLSDPSSVIGRDKEKDAIVKLLVELESDEVPVIPIVGMGGVGKTTLSRLVFNDEKVEKYFYTRIWVCVSNDFDVDTIAKKVLGCVTEDNCDRLQMEVVQRLLREKLKKKRYLLVLDDVWIENHDNWIQLKVLLMCGKERSKILVTTRSKKVASIVSPTSRHFLLGPLLDDVHCWLVFKQRAFREGEEEKHKTTLVPIGEKIVRKCQGVPLAITALGSLLHSNTDKGFWEFVQNNEIWKVAQHINKKERKSINIFPILKFSYDHLPSHLKACFAYCSVFPKDCDIYRETLIYLWMANGLIQSTDQEMEDVGNEYFRILLSRTLFQDAKEREYDDESIIICKMYDLMHDLARYIAGTEYLIVGEVPDPPQAGDITSPQGSARHSWLSGQLNPQLLNTAKKLRTLLKPDRLELSLPDNKCLSFKRLRALDLSWSKLGRLPDSICELKHLRYLDLSHSHIKALPDSFSRLQNLQTLKVFSCEHLGELPKDMWKMVKLRHIINKGTSLTHMPSGLRKLSSLQTLQIFVVGDNIGGSRISDLGPLDGLRGELRIQNLEHVRDPTDAGEASLEKKQNLSCLELMWDWKKIWNGRQQDHDDLWGRLHPPTNLKKLVIDGYVGVKFPDWRMYTLKGLVSITLSNFSGCDDLSALVDLPSLQFLRLGDMPHLGNLYLRNLPKLEKWEAQSSHLPHLTTLEITCCPSLVAMPFFPSLQKWKLERSRGELLLHSMKSNQTSSTLSGISTLKSLRIVGCDDLECLPAEGLQNLVSLEDLHIERCSSLKSLSEDVLWQLLPALQSLFIGDDPMITS